MGSRMECEAAWVHGGLRRSVGLSCGGEFTGSVSQSIERQQRTDLFAQEQY